MTLNITTDNAAFHEGEEDEESEEISQSTRSECARILREVADSLDNGSDSGRCMDANGNKVGSWSL